MRNIREIFGIRKAYNDEDRFGVEVEVEGKNLPYQLDEYFNVERDGSLKADEAYEYVFNKPLSIYKTRDALNYLYDNINKEGSVDSSVRAGVHVHINTQNLTFKQLITFIVAYYIVEEIVTDYCGEGRVGNHFCLRLKDTDYMVRNLISVINSKSFNHVLNDNIRYSALNLKSLRKFGSVEFRAMGTTQTAQPIYMWCRILNSIYKNTLKHYDNPEKILEDVSIYGGEAVFNKLFPLGSIRKALNNGKDIHNQMMDGTRLVQDIVYCVDWKTYNFDEVKNPFISGGVEEVEEHVVRNIKPVGLRPVNIKWKVIEPEIDYDFNE